MFDLERAITEWKKTMRRSPSIDDGDLAELERYLRDKVEDLIRQGSGPEEAYRKAEAEFRKAGALDMRALRVADIEKDGLLKPANRIRPQVWVCQEENDHGEQAPQSQVPDFPPHSALLPRASCRQRLRDPVDDDRDAGDRVDVLRGCSQAKGRRRQDQRRTPDTA